jgi:hypothetical protein
VYFEQDAIAAGWLNRTISMLAKRAAHRRPRQLVAVSPAALKMRSLEIDDAGMWRTLGARLAKCSKSLRRKCHQCSAGMSPESGRLRYRANSPLSRLSAGEAVTVGVYKAQVPRKPETRSGKSALLNGPQRRMAHRGALMTPRVLRGFAWAAG